MTNASDAMKAATGIKKGSGIGKGKGKGLLTRGTQEIKVGCSDIPLLDALNMYGPSNEESDNDTASYASEEKKDEDEYEHPAACESWSPDHSEEENDDDVIFIKTEYDDDVIFMSTVEFCQVLFK
jgi:hypothetical protein